MATVFTVRAAAGKGEFSVSLASEKPLVLKVGIPEEPEGGRANRRLLSELGKRLSCRVEILAGHRNKKKTMAADCSPETVVGMARGQWAR